MPAVTDRKQWEELMSAGLRHSPSAVAHACARLHRIHSLQAAVSSSPWIHDVIELAMATAISTPLTDLDDTALVWLIVVGNPSGGKTRAVSGLSGDKVIRIDTLTPNALSSGYVSPPEGGKRRNEEPDLLTEMQTKGAQCLVIKDLSPLFSQRDDKVRAVLGDLTSIYDGEFNKATGTLGRLQYKPRFGVVACVTPIVLEKHRHYMSQLGTRFLMYRVEALTNDEVNAGITRLRDEDDRRGKLRELTELVERHVSAILRVPPPKVVVPSEHQDCLDNLGKMLARGRALIEWQQDRDSKSWQMGEVQQEEPFRAIEQVSNLAKALALVHGREVVETHDVELVRRVVLGSMLKRRADVLRLFASSPEGLTHHWVCDCPRGARTVPARSSMSWSASASSCAWVTPRVGPATRMQCFTARRPGRSSVARVSPGTGVCHSHHNAGSRLDHLGDLGGFSDSTPHPLTVPKKKRRQYAARRHSRWGSLRGKLLSLSFGRSVVRQRGLAGLEPPSGGGRAEPGRGVDCEGERVCAQVKERRCLPLAELTRLALDAEAEGIARDKAGVVIVKPAARRG